MSPALGAIGLRPTMSHVAVGLRCASLRAMKALPSSGRRAMRFGRLGGEPARLRGGSSAWHAGLTGSPGARDCSGDGSRRPPVDRNEFAIRAGCHVAVGQHGGKDVRGRLELQAQNAGKSAFAGFDDGAGVMGDQPAQHGAGVLGVAQVTGAVQGIAGPSRLGRARSRCRAATRRLPGDRHPRRERLPGCVPARRRLGRAPSGGAGAHAGAPGRDVRPTKPARSCGQG
jgi:hypothetical protein